MKLIINEYQNNFLVNKSVMLDIVNVDVYNSKNSFGFNFKSKSNKSQNFSILKNAKNHTLENITENALIDLMDNIDTLKTLKIDSYKYENDDETITEIYINISY